MGAIQSHGVGAMQKYNFSALLMGALLLWVGFCQERSSYVVPEFRDYCDDTERTITIGERRYAIAKFLYDKRKEVRKKYGDDVLLGFYKWIEKHDPRDLEKALSDVDRSEWDCCTLLEPSYKTYKWFDRPELDQSEMYSLNGYSSGLWIYDVHVPDMLPSAPSPTVELVVGTCNTVGFLERP